MARKKHRAQTGQRVAGSGSAALAPGGHTVATGPAHLTPGGMMVRLALIVGSALVAYLPVVRAGYVRFDDTDYIEENQLLRTASGLARIWTSPQAYPPGVPYYPVTFSLHWAEFRLWGVDPRGYHLVSLGLHAVNAVLVWLLLYRLGVPGALLGGLLFAVHPVQVQSVAWLAERKNVLSATFYFLAALAWLRFARTGSRPWYAVSLATFLLGLLSKTVICTLPAALLLWIWWRRPARSGKYLLLLGPLVCLSVLLVAVTFWRENTLLEGKSFESGLSAVQRLLIVGRAMWFYLAKLLVPVNLIPIYPHWPVDTGAIGAYAFPLGWAVVIVAAWLLRRRVGRSPLAAILFFVIGLTPTSGLIDFGYLAKSFVGDHYQYIPSLGIFAGLAALVAQLAARLGRRAAYAGAGLAAALLLSLGVRTWRQCGVYRDAESFWSYVVAHNPSPTALSALGDVYFLKRDLPRAEELLRRALAGRDSARTRFRLGCVLIERQQLAAAAEEFERALWLNRTRDRIRGLNARLLFNLGFCYSSLGQHARAAEAYRQARELDPSLMNPSNPQERPGN